MEILSFVKLRNRFAQYYINNAVNYERQHKTKLFSNLVTPQF